MYPSRASRFAFSGRRVLELAHCGVSCDTGNQTASIYAGSTPCLARRGKDCLEFSILLPEVRRLSAHLVRRDVFERASVDVPYSLPWQSQQVNGGVVCLSVWKLMVNSPTFITDNLFFKSLTSIKLGLSRLCKSRRFQTRHQGPSRGCS